MSTYQGAVDDAGASKGLRVGGLDRKGRFEIRLNNLDVDKIGGLFQLPPLWIDSSSFNSFGILNDKNNHGADWDFHPYPLTVVSVDDYR